MHSADQTPNTYALKKPDDNGLCDDCHDTYFQPGSGGSYGGSLLYKGSSHGSEHTMIWPGPDPPPRNEADAAGKCLNCHDPHGWTDNGGLIPFLAIGREETLCQTCHDGSPATDVRTDMLKPYAHPTDTFSGRHTGPDETQPSDFGAAPSNRRHAECVDCHNPHVARSDVLTLPPAPAASKRLLGVSRVVVLNGAAGTAPVYTFVQGSDTLTAPVTEYQLCFKCHSSWTTQPTGQSDLAALLNPNNPSYHPVEAAGRDPLIPSGAFEPGWSASSVLRCSDCHHSDDGSLRGPHGSHYPAILPRPYDPRSVPRVVESDEACFACHSFATYADSTAGPGAHSMSRFNEPGAVRGHAGHAAVQVPCGACHVTHGSATQPHLITTGALPGILSITWTANGATCTPSCHAAESYTINYGR
jgi:predicted CXXCH cytochrome family protein